MSHRKLRLDDPGLAVVFVVAGQLELRGHVADGSVVGPVWLNVLVSLVVCAPLALRHRTPLGALTTSALGLLLTSLAFAHSVFFWTDLLPLAILVWSATGAGDSAVHRWCWTLPVVALCSVMLRVDSDRDPANVVMAVLLYAGSSAAARLARRYLEQRRQLREALALLDAEQARSEQDAVIAERLRIAGEIEDVVAHALGVLVVQIGAARLGLARSDIEVPGQLVAAERSAREALGELRNGIVVVDPAETGALAPLPGLGEIPALVDRFRAAGLVVDLELAPGPGLATSLQLTVYRVLQEALTNAAKHGDPPHATAVVRGGGSAVLVEVRNRTAPTSRVRLPRGGHGLIGMRERVTALGGRLEAGATASGFRVHAVLPVAAVALDGAERAG